MARFWKALFGIAVFVVVAGSLAADVRAHPRYVPDGFLYTRMMLVDRGMSEDAALAAARDYYATTNAATDPEAPGFYGAHPPRFFTTEYSLFRARQLYPRLASALAPALGFHALETISIVSIAIAAVAIYALLLLVAPPWLAACGALAAAAHPLVHEAGTVAATDGLGFAAWAIVLLATVRYARAPSRAMLALAVLAALVLAFTRPAVWLPVGAAAGFAFAARSRAAYVLLAAQLAVAAVAVGATVAMHGAGLMEQLRWQYDWHVERHAKWVGYGLAGWWALFVLRDLVIEPLWLLADGVPVFAIVVAAIGLWRRRGDPFVPIALGVLVVTPIVLLVNPTDIRRAVEIPLVPILAYGICSLIAQALRTAEREATGPLSRTGTASPTPSRP